MPQYLFAVDVDSVKAYTWCKDHGLNPGCSHADPYAGYVAGRYLVNLNDSVDNSINKLQDAAKFKYDNYTRLAFVEAVHRGDSLYVMKNGITLESIMAKILLENLISFLLNWIKLTKVRFMKSLL